MFIMTNMTFSFLPFQFNHLLDNAPKKKMHAKFIQRQMVKTTTAIVEAWEAWGMVANGDNFYVLDKDIAFYKVSFCTMSAKDVRRDLSTAKCAGDST